MKKLLLGLVIVMLAWSVNTYGETKTAISVNFDDREYVGVTLQGLGTENEVGISGTLGTFRPNDENIIMTYFGFGINKRLYKGAFVGIYSAFVTKDTYLRGDVGFELLWAFPLKELDINGLVLSIAYDDLVGTSVGIGGYW